MKKENFVFSSPKTQITQEDNQINEFELEGEIQSISVDDYQLNQTSKKNRSKKQRSNQISWTLQDEKSLISLHKQYGNKWTLLSKHFMGSCQNFIKNHYYSRMRKSVRKLNKNILNSFSKQYNKFNLNIIFKLSNISEKKVIGKCNIEDQITLYYKEFAYRLIDFSQNQDQQLDYKKDMLNEIQTMILSLIALENLFRIISGERIYKGKKKNIAYLKRSNFQLNCQSSKYLVITKQRCFISNQPVDIDAQCEKSFQSIENPEYVELDQSSKLYFKNLKSEHSSTELCSNETTYSQLEVHFQVVDRFDQNEEIHIEQNLYESIIFSEELHQIQITQSNERIQQIEDLFQKYGGRNFYYQIQ